MQPVMRRERREQRAILLPPSGAGTYFQSSIPSCWSMLDLSWVGIVPILTFIFVRVVVSSVKDSYHLSPESPFLLPLSGLVLPWRRLSRSPLAGLVRRNYPS